MLSLVKHAGPEALDRLEPFRGELRSVAGLVEKKPGVFYRKSRAFLHFHEDPSGLHADVRVGDDFERLRVETDAERAALLRLIRSL
jgi:hypothetical protein